MTCSSCRAEHWMSGGSNGQWWAQTTAISSSSTAGTLTPKSPRPVALQMKGVDWDWGGGREDSENRLWQITFPKAKWELPAKLKAAKIKRVLSERPALGWLWRLRHPYPQGGASTESKCFYWTARVTGLQGSPEDWCISMPTGAQPEMNASVLSDRRSE